MCVLLAAVALCLLLSAVSGSQVEQLLYHDLLREYDTCCRPVRNVSSAVIVNVKLAFNRFSYDATENKMRVNVWSHQTWKDEFLSWNPEKYEGVEDTRFESGRIWQPDIKLYTPNDQFAWGRAIGPKQSLTQSTVYSDGTVTLIEPKVWDTYMCEQKQRDGQPITECLFGIGSWVFDGFRLDLELTEQPETDDFVANHKYDLVQVKAKRVERFMPCCPEPYPKITYIVRIKKTPAASNSTSTSA